MKSLRADHPDLEPSDLDDGRGAVEDNDAGVGEGSGDLRGAVEMPVVVAEHRDHRQTQIPAGAGEDFGLARRAVRRQIPRQQDEVRLVPDGLERGAKLFLRPLPGMDVAGGGDPDRLTAALFLPVAVGWNPVHCRTPTLGPSFEAPRGG